MPELITFLQQKEAELSANSSGHGHHRTDFIVVDSNGAVITAGSRNTDVTITGNNETITLGNGDNTIFTGPVLVADIPIVREGNGVAVHLTDSGNNDVITVGNGDNTITDGGNNNAITVGNGDNNIILSPVGAPGVTLPGPPGPNSGNSVVAGNGDNTVFAFGQLNGTLGSGNNTISALDHSSIAINAKSHSVDTVSVGPSSIVTQTNGTLDVTSMAVGDIFILNNVTTKLTLGTESRIAFGVDSSADLTLFHVPGVSGDMISVQSDKTPTGVDTGKYTGDISIAGFLPGSDTIDLQGFGFANFADVQPHITTTATDATIHLPGGGIIAIATTATLTASDVAFSSNHGPVSMAS
jgi:hypothetical protein